jgi:hypothetical protein
MATTAMPETNRIGKRFLDLYRNSKMRLLQWGIASRGEVIAANKISLKNPSGHERVSICAMAFDLGTLADWPSTPVENPPKIFKNKHIHL